MAINVQTDDLFDKKDAGRYNGDSAKLVKEPYLTEGPGHYELELVSMRSGTSKSKKRFGQQFIAAVFEVTDARSITRDGTQMEPTHAPGEKVQIVKFLNTRISTKEALEMVGAVVGTPPVLAIPDGPHQGNLLPMVDGKLVNECCDDDGAAVAGTKLRVDVVPREVTKGKYAGRTFHNAYFLPASGQWPTWEDLAEPADLDEMVKAKFGSR